MVKTNKQMREIVDLSEDYCPININGELQEEVDNNTMYIVDIGADESNKHHNPNNELMCIYDREGDNFYPVEVKPWW